MYEIAFTTGFRDGLGDMAERVIRALDQFLTPLRQDPYQKLPRAKALKNAHGRFRIRIGGDARAIYQVESVFRRVVFLAISTRQNAYRRPPPGARILDPAEGEAVLATIKGKKVQTAPLAVSTAPAVDASSSRLANDNDPAQLSISVEPVTEWITADELWLLNIDERYWESILAASDVGSIDPVVPPEILTRLIDYTTNPASSHIGKLYSLGSDELMDVAKRPLRSFLLALAPEQQKIIDRPLDAGPILVKGGPGTGKSLIGLYRIRHIVENRTAESLFTQRPRFGILTYTNTLSGLNDVLAKDINAKLEAENGQVVCSTLDKVAYEVASAALGRRPNPANDVTWEKLLEQHVLPKVQATTSDAIHRLGLHYLVEEIDRVILGYGIHTLEEYQGHRRTGRKVAMIATDRTEVWKLYEEFRFLHEERKVETFSLIRSIALKHLKDHPEYPRFNALFVDEVQDLSRTARQLVLELVADKRFLLMTADTGQSIYEHPPTWVETDPTLNLRGGRIHVLRRNYRSTKEIYAGIEALREESDDGEGVTGRPLSVFSGRYPIWLKVKGDAQVSTVALVIKSLSSTHALGQIAVVVRDNDRLKTYASYLESQGIPSRAVTQSVRIDVDGNHVHVITAHSSKGLEFPAVVVPDVSDSQYPWAYAMRGCLTQEQTNETLEKERRLLYVALSRASHTLVMLENEDAPSPFLKLLPEGRWSSSL